MTREIRPKEVVAFRLVRNFFGAEDRLPNLQEFGALLGRQHAQAGRRMYCRLRECGLVEKRGRHWRFTRDEGTT